MRGPPASAIETLNSADDVAKVCHTLRQKLPQGGFVYLFIEGEKFDAAEWAFRNGLFPWEEAVRLIARCYAQRQALIGTGPRSYSIGRRRLDRWIGAIAEGIGMGKDAFADQFRNVWYRELAECLYRMT